jgi:hypothetical protein
LSVLHGSRNSYPQQTWLLAAGFRRRFGLSNSFSMADGSHQEEASSNAQSAQDR